MVDYSQLVPFVPAVAAVSNTVFMLGSAVAVVVGSGLFVVGDADVPLALLLSRFSKKQEAFLTIFNIEYGFRVAHF